MGDDGGGSASIAPDSYSAGPPEVLTWNTSLGTAGALAAGETGLVTFQVVVDQPLDPAITDFTNTAVMSTSATSDITDTTVTTVVMPSLSIVKSADVTLLGPGDTVTYTMVVTNSGDGAATGIRITDTLPTDTYFTYDTGSTTVNGTSVADPVTGSAFDLTIDSALSPDNDLDPGESATIQYTMTVAATGVPAGDNQKTNQASVEDAQTSPPSDTSDPVTVTISSNPLLSITKTYTGTAAAGEIITYEMIVTNTGGSDAEDVVVYDPIPSYTQYNPGSVTCTSGCTSIYYKGANNSVVFEIGTLAAAGSVTLTFEVVIDSVLPYSPSPIPTTISNTATVTASNASSREATAEFDVTAEPVITLTKTGPSSVAYPATTLNGAAGGTTFAVHDSSQLSVGQYVYIGGDTAQIDEINGNDITVDDDH